MILSMSLSGTLLILILLFCGRLWKGRLSRQWQYYIWLIVVMRFLLPFGPETGLMERVYPAADGIFAQMTQVAREMREVQETSPNGEREEKNAAQGSTQVTAEKMEKPDAAFHDVQETEFGKENHGAVGKDSAFLAEAADFAENYLWIVWLTIAFGMLIRKITAYRSYLKYVITGAEPVSDISLLDQLAVAAQEMGIGRPVELCVNPLVTSPMLAGYFYPCIVLPRVDVSEKKFQYIVMHELMHCRRRDIWYKWLVQLTVCLHWFNPFVYLMRREIERNCEFSCDEAVVAGMGYEHAKDYGETLLDAMANVGMGRESFAAVTMSADKELLKERLGAIMRYQKKTRSMRIFTAGLTVAIALGVFFLGVYPVEAAEPEKTKSVAQFDKGGESLAERAKSIVQSDRFKALAQEKQTDENGTAVAKVEDLEKYYTGRSLPMFHIAFGELNEKEQESWLDRIYADGEIDFFSVSVWQLDANSSLIQSFAAKFYEEDDIAFFSVLADQMDEETLEKWLDRALTDEKWNFQSMLYDELDRDGELDALEKALEEEQLAQYRAVGVTKNGKNYYYKGQFVNIFLDIHRPNQSFYTLSMNPAGTVNVKIIRAEDGRITGAAYMTEAEIEELFGDMEEDMNAGIDEEAETFPQEMTVAMPVCKIREGAGEEFQVVGLIGEGETVTVLGKEEGKDGQMWYLLDKESLSEPPDDSVKECYIRADLLQKQ